MLTLFTQDMAFSRSGPTLLMPVLRFVLISSLLSYDVIQLNNIRPLGAKFFQDCFAFDFIKSLVLAND
jgi:hypothetical protein